MLEIAKETLLGLGIAGECFADFFTEAEAWGTSVDDTVNEGNPLGSFDTDSGTGTIDGGGRCSVESGLFEALFAGAPADHAGEGFDRVDGPDGVLS